GLGGHPHITSDCGTAVLCGMWPPEEGMPTDGPLGKARLQAGLPRQRGADRAGHMYAGMLDRLSVQQDRVSVGSRHVSRQLHATLAAARPAEQLPRQLWPGVGGLRAGPGYEREELSGPL